jgi:hypothetical protein
MRSRLVILAAVLAVSACGNPPEGTANETAGPAAAAETPAAAAAAAPPPPAAPVPATPTTYTLAGNGLSPGLSFGMLQADAVKAATAAFGAPTKDREHNDECGEGPMDFFSFNDLQLGFHEGELAGWSLGGPKPALRTAGGLAIGAPRSAIGDAAIDEESTLGPEFSINDVGGLLSDDGKTIAALWAGYPCQFR